ncbi:unnamed protein product, partial [Iphiclides podalirius]
MSISISGTEWHVSPLTPRINQSSFGPAANSRSTPPLPPVASPAPPPHPADPCPRPGRTRRATDFRT